MRLWQVELPASYVSRDLQQRHGDLVRRIRFGGERWLYLVLLLEFQSGVDRAMAVRMLTYSGLLYQRLVAEGVLRDGGERVAWPDRYRQVQGLDRRPKGTAGREWQGQELAGQSILLYGEQGLGDVIQYARYAPLVAARGARVVVACKPRLVALLRRLPGVDRIVPQDQPPPPTDWHCSLLDVPAAWGDDADSIPSTCPYLPPVRRARPVLPPARQFRVGIVWGGNPEQKRDRLRSCRLDDFAPLFEPPGSEFVSFQVGPRAPELRAGWRGLVRDPGDALTDLEARADALLEVDLVITVDTMLAHLAGALGRPVWTLLAFVPDMRSRRPTTGPASSGKCGASWPRSWRSGPARGGKHERRHLIRCPASTPASTRDAA